MNKHYIHEVQVYEGSDASPSYLMMKEVEEITQMLVDLLVDCDQLARFLDNPSIVTVRLIFANDVVAFLRDQVTYSKAAMGVRDLEELAGHLEIRNRPSTAARLRLVVDRIQKVREVRNAA